MGERGCDFRCIEAHCNELLKISGGALTRGHREWVAVEARPSVAHREWVAYFGKVVVVFAMHIVAQLVLAFIDVRVMSVVADGEVGSGKCRGVPVVLHLEAALGRGLRHRDVGGRGRDGLDGRRHLFLAALEVTHDDDDADHKERHAHCDADHHTRGHAGAAAGE